MSLSGRLFYGIPLPPDVRASIDAAIGSDAVQLPARPVPAENWHITLRFLGATADEQGEGLHAAVARADLPTPFRITLSGWGAFPRPQAARVLWIGVRDQTGSLARIAATIESAARRAGFDPETRPFEPHITIARIRAPTDVRSPLARLPHLDLTFEVNRVTLFRSTLGHGPPRYDAVRTVSLEN